MEAEKKEKAIEKKLLSLEKFLTKNLMGEDSRKLLMHFIDRMLTEHDLDWAWVKEVQMIFDDQRFTAIGYPESKLGIVRKDPIRMSLLEDLIQVLKKSKLLDRAYLYKLEHNDECPWLLTIEECELSFLIAPSLPESPFCSDEDDPEWDTTSEEDE